METPNGTRLRRNRSHLRDMTVQRSVSFEDEEVINRDHPNSHSEHSSPESMDKDTHLVPNVRTLNAGVRRITCPDIQTGDGDVQRKSCRVIIRPTRYDS